jgi:putative glutamine transport system substrate-binding protein
VRVGALFSLSLGIILLVAACSNAGPATGPGNTPIPEGQVEEDSATTPTLPSAAKPAAALAPEGTLLRQIQDRGKLVCGTTVAVRTFGYLNPESGEVEGFAVEVCKALAAHIIGDPGAVEAKEANLREHLQLLNDGVVDVIASTLTITADRLETTDFSDVYFVAGQTLLVPADSAIATVDDLANKVVGVAQGTTSETNIAALAEEKGLGAEVQLFDSSAEALAAMDEGRVDAITGDDVILYGFVRQEPEKWKVVGGQLAVEPYGIAVKKGETELLAAVNAVVHDLKTSGRWQELYAEWISGGEAPAPPPDDWQAVTKP